MTERAGAIYASVDPAQIPAGHTVRQGSGHLVGPATREHCLVQVTTTEGAYQVSLVAEEGHWLVDRLIQPES